MDLMRQGLVEFVTLGLDLVVEQAGGVQQRLHEGESPPKIERQQKQAEKGENLARLRQPADMPAQVVGGLRADAA